MLDLIAAFAFRIPLSLTFNVFKAAIGASARGLPLRPSIQNACARAIMDCLHPHQVQAIAPSTMQTYTSWIRRNAQRTGLYHRVDTLKDETTHLVWLGPKRSDKVILFFHGGGYVLPLSGGHLDWMAHVRKSCLEASLDVSVCILEYSLVPGHRYPTQLRQALMGLQHLVDHGYKLSDIILGGDSAGGHLSLSVLSALMHPHPHHSSAATTITSTVGNDSGRLRGCFLISPLLSLDLTTPSYRQRFSVDVLSPYVVRTFAKYLVDQTSWHEEISQGKGWGMALDVPSKWWNNLGLVVDELLVTAGQEEIFRDHVGQFVQLIRQQTTVDLVAHIALDEAHDAPLMDFVARRPPRGTTEIVTRWIVDAFQKQD
ncbi:alpha/beta hydrolase [Aspergillus brunneoviolaceus CBS 621.78]|uniref:Alpha/beta-hydrolase n=1 Tax=Aspergillus brunneoviolaceus CBS 621.78 TaxID=1450534 RepID=A0ACD1GEP8_9EURO|nr:alpha/beta-hydrolase [Aspergillus brunneoviolaceus CBS 621.78]RAH47697.1 alpha/beta-hydrolase [Aspergillus brunneoviolaceus CBS 621.78]